jgi:hypothetical protein
MRLTRVSTVTSSPKKIGERKPVEWLARRQDVEQVADTRLLDVAEEDRVVHVPERIDVAESHLERGAVAELIGHGRPS